MIRGRSQTQLGVTASIASSMVFAVVFVLSAHLDATANELFGWRTFFTVVMLLAFLTAAKRWTGIKDFSHALPGHGGFLDRFDSVLFSLPVSLVLATLFYLM